MKGGREVSVKPDYKKASKIANARNVAVKTVTYALLSLWGLIVLFPFYWMILTSIKSYGAYNSEYIPKFFTLNPDFGNYIYAFTEVPLAKYFLNTLIFTVITTALMLIIIIPAAFAFARLEFKGKNLTFLLLLSLMMKDFSSVTDTWKKKTSSRISPSGTV